MINKIGEILKTELLNEVYVDKIAGIVQVAIDKQIAGEKTIVKRFPVACNVEGVNCDEKGRLKDLVPNDAKKSVIFFEDISGVKKIQNRGKYIIFEANPKMIVWLNRKKLGKTDCAISPIIAANIIKKLEGINRRNIDEFLNVSVEVISEMPNNISIFSNYTFDPYQQYFVYPFEYFALMLKVTFWVNTDCIEDFILGTEDNCNTQ